MHEQLSD